MYLAMFIASMQEGIFFIFNNLLIVIGSLAKFSLQWNILILLYKLEKEEFKLQKFIELAIWKYQGEINH